jgi:rod shape-determining protein MreC
MPIQKILNIIEKYKEYFTFVILIIISLSLVSVGDISKIGGFRTIVIGMVGWTQSLFSWIPNTGAIKSENNALREMNLQLSSEVIQSRISTIENKSLRDFLKLRQKEDYQYITAEVVGMATIDMRTYATIDKGTNQAVDEGMSVRTDAGLIGVIIGASKNYALVELILNRDMKIAAKVAKNMVYGIASWEGGEFFFLKNIPKSFDIKPGDTIITSDLNNKYPPNIPLGMVIDVRKESGDIFLKVTVKPFANFSVLEQVFVIKYIPNPERIELIKEMDERLRARKEEPKHKR